LSIVKNFNGLIKSKDNKKKAPILGASFHLQKQIISHSKV